MEFASKSSIVSFEVKFFPLVLLSPLISVAEVVRVKNVNVAYCKNALKKSM